MSREQLEEIRRGVVGNLIDCWESVRDQSAAPAMAGENIVALNALHEIACRELRMPESQHPVDDLVCGIEVAYGHLLRFEAAAIPDLDAVEACKITLEALLRKERAP